jgi:hypothetical protein
MRSATKTVASTFGVIVGLAGLEHGIGEILQGRVAPPAVMFESWPNSEVLRVMAGEPAMSLLPDLLLSGILTVLLSLATIVWSVAFLGRQHAGSVLILLSTLLLLVGGGIAPPLMGLIVGGAATRIRKPLTRWRQPGQDSRPPLLARLWAYLLAASVVGYLALLPGIPLASLWVAIEDPAVVGYLALFSFLSLILATVGALVSDSYHSGQALAEAGTSA